MDSKQNVRPTVTVFSAETGKSVARSVPLPTVFSSPIRTDIIQFVHTNINKNHRQPHGVSQIAGHQTSAVSWGTGRAVARVPRVSGSGTGRNGQGAYANFARGGHMFNPKVTWRRWNRKVALTMKRHAVASAIASTAVPALVQARGHHISKLAEIPLVVETSSFEKIAKTKDAVAFLKRFRLFDDVKRVIVSKRLRNGKGKMRNRRYKIRKGPLIIFKEKSPIIRAFRNIPGVDLMCVKRMNLLKLTPGGHVGRLVVWTNDAFTYLEDLFGNYEKRSKVKRGYALLRPTLTNSDLHSIINSDAVQSHLRPKYRIPFRPRKRNPFKNLRAMGKLNPQRVADKKTITKMNKANAEKTKEYMEKKKLRKAALKAGKKEEKQHKKPIPADEFKKKRKECLKKRNLRMKKRKQMVRILLGE